MLHRAIYTPAHRGFNILNQDEKERQQMQETTRKRHNQTKIASPQASNHRLLYFIATLLFILAAALAAPMTARAAGTEPTSKDNVYQIRTAEELIWFRDAVNGGSADISAKLTKDIVLTG